MKRLSLILILFLGVTSYMLAGSAAAIDVPTADSLYKIEDYAIPSFIPFLAAKETARANPSEENLAAMNQKIAELKSYQYPYDVVVNINGDPSTQMAFAWFTNDRMTEGKVQLITITDSTVLESVFDEATDVISVEATPTTTKKIRYAIGLSGIPTATGLSVSTKFKYTSYKVIAKDLAPNTLYAYRVGTDNYWSEVGTFMTAPVNKPFQIFFLLPFRFT
mgnify:CR=1 FL=1